jgi:hypothetical protein
MALVIEDGTGKADAQSYVSAADARTFATARGVTLSVDDVDVEAKLVLAMDYIEAHEPRFKGYRSSDTQALSWPRTEAYIVPMSTSPWADDAIPPTLKNAQSHLVMARHSGLVLQPNLDPAAQIVKREKVDVIETEFFGPGEAGKSYGSQPAFPLADASLAPLLRAGGGVNAMAYRG